MPGPGAVAAAAPAGPQTTVRPFQRSDRDQVTDLVNAHLAAILPGLSVPVSTVLSQLEREPDEYVVDPWVETRLTLIAEQHRRIVAAAHLVRYCDADQIGPDYRGAGEIRWLLCWPTTGPRYDYEAAGAQLVQACVRQLDGWQARRQYANGGLPAPAAYGVPEVWPHVRRLLTDAGFVGGREEQILVVRVATLAADRRRGRTPWPELHVTRSVGAAGTRFSAVDSERRWGYLEVDTTLTEHRRFARGPSVADIGNVWVEPAVRRRGLARWLLAETIRWLDLAGIELLLGYVDETTSAGEIAFLTGAGFDPLITTSLGWERPSRPSPTAE
ncbi:MAG: GNAT family N-acetyltransferase, partial [Propionibacteriaceae bacterium]